MRYRLVQQQRLHERDRQSMFELLRRYFDGVDRTQFEADLGGKNWVILLYDLQTGCLRGFSTLLLYDTRAQGRRWSIIYSGDTIVEPTAWRNVSLAQAGMGALCHLRNLYGKDPIHWLLLASGYRTYRYLPVFWREFYPRHDAPTPAAVSELLDELAQQRFGRQYDAAHGIVRFDKPQRLKEHLSQIPAGRRRDPHVAFFERANRGHLRGDELVCFTELAEANLTCAGRRVWRAGHTLFPSEEQPA